MQFFVQPAEQLPQHRTVAYGGETGAFAYAVDGMSDVSLHTGGECAMLMGDL